MSYYKEFLLELDAGCRPHIVMNAKQGPGSMVDSHWHDYYEVLYLLCGEAEQVLDDKTWRLKEGDIVVITPRTAHATQALSVQCNIVVVLFPPGDGLNPEGGVINAPYPFSWEIEELFSRMYREYQQKLRGYEQIITGCLRELTGYLCRFALSEGVQRTGDFRNMQQIFDFIEQHLTCNMTVAQAAKEIGYSADYFSKLCRKYSGCSFKSYMDHLKMSRAVRMMLFENRTVGETAELLGYSNTSSFCRAFRRVNGHSPSQLLQTDYSAKD